MTEFIDWGIENAWRGILSLRDPANAGRATRSLFGVSGFLIMGWGLGLWCFCW